MNIWRHGIMSKLFVFRIVTENYNCLQKSIMIISYRDQYFCLKYLKPNNCTLASVFEKSATELKQSKLLKCKQTLQIATFNVRTLNRIGQLPELIASAEEHKIDIICIQEHRYTHTEDIKYHETGNGWSLATVESAWKNSVNTAVGGVA